MSDGLHHDDVELLLAVQGFDLHLHLFAHEDLHFRQRMRLFALQRFADPPMSG